jgi:hypothetical protein
MTKSMSLLLVTAALVASAASHGSASAAPMDGAAIAKAASADSLVEKVYPVRWASYRSSAYRPGRCNDSPAHC